MQRGGGKPGAFIIYHIIQIDHLSFEGLEQKLYRRLRAQYRREVARVSNRPPMANDKFEMIDDKCPGLAPALSRNLSNKTPAPLS